MESLDEFDNTAPPDPGVDEIIQTENNGLTQSTNNQKIPRRARLEMQKLRMYKKNMRNTAPIMVKDKNVETNPGGMLWNDVNGKSTKIPWRARLEKLKLRMYKNNMNNSAPIRVKEKNVDTNPGAILENDVKSKLSYTDMGDVKEKKRDIQKNLQKVPKNNKKQVLSKNIAKHFKDKKISNSFKHPTKIPTFDRIFFKNQVDNTPPLSQPRGVDNDITQPLNSSEKTDNTIDTTITPADSLKSKFGKKTAKRPQKLKLRRDLPPKITKLNCGDKRVLRDDKRSDGKMKKVKTYSIIRSSNNYDT